MDERRGTCECGHHGNEHYTKDHYNGNKKGDCFHLDIKKSPDVLSYYIRCSCRGYRQSFESTIVAMRKKEMKKVRLAKQKEWHEQRRKENDRMD